MSIALCVSFVFFSARSRIFRDRENSFSRAFLFDGSCKSRLQTIAREIRLLVRDFFSLRVAWRVLYRLIFVDEFVSVDVSPGRERLYGDEVDWPENTHTVYLY